MRRITQLLYIGNADDGRRHGTEFDRVVSLAAESDETTHGYPIRDGEHNYDVFKQAVDAICDGLDNNEKTLVHCQAGLSRSVSATIAALVVAEDWEFEDAYETCRSGFIYPAPELIESTERYINSNAR